MLEHLSARVVLGSVIQSSCAVGNFGRQCFVALQIMSFGPGQYFGENALLDNYRYNASAVARGRASVLRASKADFNMVSSLTL